MKPNQFLEFKKVLWTAFNPVQSSRTKLILYIHTWTKCDSYERKGWLHSCEKYNGECYILWPSFIGLTKHSQHLTPAPPPPLSPSVIQFKTKVRVEISCGGPPQSSWKTQTHCRVNSLWSTFQTIPETLNRPKITVWRNKIILNKELLIGKKKKTSTKLRSYMFSSLNFALQCLKIIVSLENCVFIFSCFITLDILFLKWLHLNVH